jgi:hypothetical protein
LTSKLEALSSIACTARPKLHKRNKVTVVVRSHWKAEDKEVRVMGVDLINILHMNEWKCHTESTLYN